MTESSVLHNTFFSTRLTTKHAFAFLSLKCIPSCRKTVDLVKRVKSTDWQISIHSQTLLFNRVIPVCSHWRKHYCIHFMMQKLFNAINIQCFSVISCSSPSQGQRMGPHTDTSIHIECHFGIPYYRVITYPHRPGPKKNGKPLWKAKDDQLCYFQWFWNKAFKQVFMKT